MSTRSAIGFIEYDNSITGIYCHFDGYYEGVGQTLLEHYNDVEKVEDLLDLGDLSALGSEIGHKHPFSRFDTNMSDTLYDAQFGEMCLSYGRDREEEGTEAKQLANMQEFTDHFKSAGCEYFYLYDGVRWYATDLKNPGTYSFLSDKLKQKVNA